MDFLQHCEKFENILNNAIDIDGKQNVAFLIRIMYRNGGFVETWLQEFDMSGSTCNWTNVFQTDRVLRIGVDDIVSVKIVDIMLITKELYERFPNALVEYKKFFKDKE